MPKIEGNESCEVTSMTTVQNTHTEKQMAKFSFSSEDIPLSHPSREEHGNFKLSRFDRELRSQWDAAVVAGHFRYKLDKMESRVIPGKYGLVAQLNESRFTQRRKAEPMSRVDMPFDHSKFNFTKIASKEVLFEVFPEHRKTGKNPHLMVINVSPLDYGNSLLVPSAQACFPQLMTEEGLELAIEVALMSSHRGFHIGFNGLCAYASVNHLHFHLWYSEYPSFLEVVNVAPVCDGVFETLDYPARMLVFELHQESEISSVAKKVHTASSYLSKKDVAINLQIIRGKPCSSSPGILNGAAEDLVALRVFLWPRQTVLHTEPYYKKGTGLGNTNRPIAVVEMAGHLNMDTRETYETFTEDMFVDNVRKSTLPNEEFELHRENIKQLLEG